MNSFECATILIQTVDFNNPFISNSIYGDLIIDNNENIYSFKYKNYRGSDNFIPRIVKLDPNTGIETDIALIDEEHNIQSLAFNPYTNQIYGLNDDYIYIINIINGTYSKVGLENSSKINIYQSLIIK